MYNHIKNLNQNVTDNQPDGKVNHNGKLKSLAKVKISQVIEGSAICVSNRPPWWLSGFQGIRGCGFHSRLYYCIVIIIYQSLCYFFTHSISIEKCK